ncbi:hypothetical protein pb186bvf_010886 [Paramecium bursaria]
MSFSIASLYFLNLKQFIKFNYFYFPLILLNIERENDNFYKGFNRSININLITLNVPPRDPNTFKIFQYER